jgi:acetoin utilization protein AcuB
MLVRSKMTPNVITAAPTTTLADALSLTRGNRIRHLPIVDNQELVGLVTDRDLRLAMPPLWANDANQAELREAMHTRTVSEVMVTNIITTPPETPVEEAARSLYEHRIGCLPVMQGTQLVGIITETDVLRAFVELFGADENGTRLEILLNNKPGELSRVVRAIGVDFKLNINGIVLPPIGEGTVNQVAVVRVATRDADALIEHLRRIGYRVGSPSLDFAPEHAHASPAPVRHWAAEGF